MDNSNNNFSGFAWESEEDASGLSFSNVFPGKGISYWLFVSRSWSVLSSWGRVLPGSQEYKQLLVHWMSIFADFEFLEIRSISFCKRILRWKRYSISCLVDLSMCLEPTTTALRIYGERETHLPSSSAMLSPLANTVEPVYNGHPWELEIGRLIQVHQKYFVDVVKCQFY